MYNQNTEEVTIL